MALVTVPASFLDVLTDARVWMERTDFETRSTFNQKRQVLSYPSASLWRIAVEIYPQDTAFAGEWRRFFMALRGRENWFRCPQPLYPGPTTGYTGAALVDGASQSGFTLALKGMTPGADVLAAGDFVTAADQCFVSDSDLAADGSGEGELSFDTPLRVSPANNAALELAQPYFLAASTTPNAAQWMSGGAMRQGFTFEGAEHR